MSSGKERPLEGARERVRNAQRIMALGFVSLVLGSVASAALHFALQPWLVRHKYLTAAYIVAGVVSALWAYVCLPFLAYGTARISELKPVPTALGGTATGLVFSLGVQVAGEGLAGLRRSWIQWTVWAAAIVLGTVLTALGVRWGRARAGNAEGHARQSAAVRKEEYENFLAESERLANRRSQVPVSKAQDREP